MLDLTQLRPNSSYYLVTFATALLLAAIMIGMKDATNSIAIFSCLAGSVVVFSVVLWQLYQQIKTSHAVTQTKDTTAKDATLDQTDNVPEEKTETVNKEKFKDKSKGELVNPALAPVDIPAIAKNESEVKLPPQNAITQPNKDQVVRQHNSVVPIDVPTSWSIQSDSKIKSLMQSSLGDILVAGLLNNPENIARIISKAIEDAKTTELKL
jgi:hypothetical protein